jgi:hypothetical protein
MKTTIRQAAGRPSKRLSNPQLRTARSRRRIPGQPVTVLFFDPATDKVVFKFRLKWELYARVRRAARQARCTAGEFIQVAFLQKLATLEKELANCPHSVRKGGAR